MCWRCRELLGRCGKCVLEMWGSVLGCGGRCGKVLGKVWGKYKGGVGKCVGGVGGGVVWGGWVCGGRCGEGKGEMWGEV